MGGLQKRITLAEAMTGREFCELVEIDYDTIVETRRADGYDNREYFVEELLRIKPVLEKMLELLRAHSLDDG